MAILKDSVIYTIGELLSKSIPFLLLPYLTRQLGPDGFGELANYQVFINLGIVFIGLSQPGAITRYFYVYGKKYIDEPIKAGNIYTLFFASILVIYSIVRNDIVLLYVVCAAVSQNLLAVQLSLLQCQKEPLLYIKVQLVNSLVSIALTFLLFYLFEPDAKYRITAIIISYLLSYFCSVKIVNVSNKGKNNNIIPDIVYFKYIVSFGAPLVFHQLSFFAKGQIDRLLIVKHYSVVELGVYSAAFQIASILSVLLLAINKAIVPYLYSALRDRKCNLKKIIKYAIFSLMLTPMPSLVAYFIPASVYSNFLGEGFSNVKYFVVVFLYGLALTAPYFIVVNYLFFYGKNKEIAICTFSSSLLHVIFLYALLDKGINYLPLALIASNAVSLMLLLCVCVYEDKNKGG